MSEYDAAKHIRIVEARDAVIEAAKAMRHVVYGGKAATELGKEELRFVVALDELEKGEE